MTKIIPLFFLLALSTLATGQLGGIFGNQNPVKSGISTLSSAAEATVKLFTKQFGDFKSTFKKQYASPEEEKRRLGIFSENQNLINAANKASQTPGSLILKASQYADLALEEFNKLINGMRADRSKSHGEKFVQDGSGIPESVDLRDQGLVTPVRSQGQCASCYAFASAAALEGHIKKATGKLESLSPQNIMDCTKDKPYINSGCNGGFVDPCFDYIKSKGINTETVYPYQSKTGEKCQFKEDNSIATVKGYVLLDEGDENGLKKAVATKGPVTAGIDAHHQSFQLYGGGIYYEPKCKSTIDAINHAVLVVGYTPEYWIIKNSYGPEWGENGYAKISRNATNHCAILTYAAYPIV